MKKTVMHDGGKKVFKYSEIYFLSDSEEKSSIKNSELQTCLKIGSIRMSVITSTILNLGE